MIKFPQGRTEVFLTYTAVVNFAIVVTALYLVWANRDIPPFLHFSFGMTFGPILYTLRPKPIG
jgi:hypothetical protein